MKKLLTAIIAIVMGGFMIAAPVFADGCNETQLKNGCVSTAILGGGCSCDNGGDSIFITLQKAIDIFSIIVGILAAIGITITGIQYLTAGGNEEKTRKSKRRLFEIIIGVAAYVLIYAFLTWLLPDFKG